MNNLKYYFFTFVAGFCFGIIGVQILDFKWDFLLLLLIISLSSIISLVLIKYLKSKEIPILVLCIVLFVLGVFFGGLRYLKYDEKSSDLPLGTYEDKKVTLVGRIVDSENSKNISLEVSGIVEDKKIIPLKSEKILLTNVVGVFEYNETIVVKGNLGIPKNFKPKEGEEAFDYVSYLERQDIYHVIAFPEIIERKASDMVTLRTLLYGIKNGFMERIQKFIPEPESSLATGVTVAGKGALPKDVEDDFVKAGLIHIVVLSGYNIAIVIRAMMYSFSFVSRRLRIVLAALGILLFVIMAGATAPVVRSAIMAGITLLGLLSYATISQNRALLGAVFLMIFFDPGALLNDASFALSVLATFAIINGVDTVKKYLGFVPLKFQIRQILSETLATQIFVLPYLLYKIGNLSIIAPISNIIVLPLIPSIMLLTFILGVVSFVPILYIPFAVTLVLLSSFVIWISEFLGNIPFAYFEIKTFPIWITLILYFGLIIVFYRHKKTEENTLAYEA